jgi:hypothetical protein
MIIEHGCFLPHPSQLVVHDGSIAALTTEGVLK